MLHEAAALGVLQVHLSGGEPAARRDLVEITAGARAAGLYTNLITSAVGVTNKLLDALVDAGLDHVQISIQDSEPSSADHIAGYDGAFVRKRALAAEVVRLSCRSRSTRSSTAPISIGSAPWSISRSHWERAGSRSRMCSITAGREESRHADADPRTGRAGAALVEDLRTRHHGSIVIDAVVPDYYARYPKPCVGGWGRRSLNVTPAGKVLPCHAAEVIPGLEFWNVRDHSLADIWANAPAFNAFRGTAWMKEPCASCARASRISAAAAVRPSRSRATPATDPVCHLAPDHSRFAELAAVRSDAPYVYRRMEQPRGKQRPVLQRPGRADRTLTAGCAPLCPTAAA